MEHGVWTRSLNMDPNMDPDMDPDMGPDMEFLTDSGQ